MRPPVTLLFATLIAIPVLAAEGARVRKDIAYSEAGGERTRLDVYAPADGDDHPVVIWIHGGAWQDGDKAHVQAKPGAFNERGYVLVSLNYHGAQDLWEALFQKAGAGKLARLLGLKVVPLEPGWN